jgi:uncharacterized membrane protein
MTTVETVLVVFLAAALLLFLVLAITAVAIAIGILRHVQNIAARADETTASFADLAKMLSRKVAPVALSAAVAAVLRRFTSKKN